MKTPTTSYVFRRRAFLQGLGGAVGLKILLRNLEASAQGVSSPPRLLITHWPVGTVRPDFVPSTSNVDSPILKPFGDAGLAGDMTAFMGLSTAMIPNNGSGGHTGGTVKLMTGVNIPGTRAGEVQGDDAFAGGPSFDQIFLKNAPMLQRPGLGFANSICDSRVDFGEISTRCLSYSYTKRPVMQVNQSQPSMENVPQLPVLSPYQQWVNLFGSFVPGGPGGGAASTLLKALQQRKSVLDLSLRQLARLRTLAPASEAAKIDVHTDAIRQAEIALAKQVQDATAVIMPGCSVPPAPPMDATGKGYDGSLHNDYGNPKAAAPDDPTHAAMGDLHLGVLKAAFVCDLIRVATFQWSPGTNHVAFYGMLSSDPTGSYMHNPESHRIVTSDTLIPQGPNRNPVVDYLTRVHTWYNARMATTFAGWKGSIDGFGGNLLDNVAIPFVTEVAACGHESMNMPAVLIGGKALGFQHGKYLSLNRQMNDFWLTVAQAFGLSASTLASETFVTQGHLTGPIDGVWAKPAG